MAEPARKSDGVAKSARLAKTTAKGMRTSRVPKKSNKTAGEYELDVTDVGADLSFKVKQFTIKRGEQFALKATFVQIGRAHV